MKTLSSRHLAEAAFRLEIARLAQAEFWKALRDLENCLGLQVESTIDLRDARAQDLLDPNVRPLILGISKDQNVQTQ